MAKFLIGVLTGVILTFLVLVTIGFAVARLREQPPEIADNSVLVLKLSGEIPERAPVEFPAGLFGGGGRPTVANVWMLLRMAAADSRVKGVVFEPESLQVGWGKLQEIRANLEAFRKSGKPVFAFLRSPGAREYYVATAADRIYLGPQDVFYVKGMRAEMMYFKGTLDKLDVNVQVQHAGKYKDFGDMFTRKEMSPETREVMNSILDDLYGSLTSTIARARRKTPDEVRAIIDQGPFLPEEARAAGLVDDLRFEDQVFGELQARLKSGELKKVSTGKYLKIPPSSLNMEGRQRIALVVAQGGITGGDEDDTGLTEQGVTSEGFNRLLRRVANDKGIKGVIVRIDSPGGEVAASDAIWREMNLLAKKKPLVISMSDTAASGGYYMALTGDPILAYPGTFTGSIGVVFGKPTLRGLYNKLGITKDTLTRGRFAAIDSDYSPLGPAEQAKLQQGIEVTYKDFVTKVAQARRRAYNEVEEAAQGRVWLGSQAKPRGLVDELGGLDRAIEVVKKKAGIPAAEKITLAPYPPRRSILDVLFRRGGEEVFDPGLEARLPGVARMIEATNARLWMKGGLLRLMPYAIDVR